LGSSDELIIVLAAAGGVAVAYATNMGGFKDWLNGLFKNNDWGGSSNITRGSQSGAYGPAPGGSGASSKVISAPTAADTCAKLGLTRCAKGLHGIPHKGGGCDCVKGYTAGFARTSAYNTDAYPDQSITVS
jgi:hypothetical protein